MDEELTASLLLKIKFYAGVILGPLLTTTFFYWSGNIITYFFGGVILPVIEKFTTIDIVFVFTTIGICLSVYRLITSMSDERVKQFLKSAI